MNTKLTNRLIWAVLFLLVLLIGGAPRSFTAAMAYSRGKLDSGLSLPREEDLRRGVSELLSSTDAHDLAAEYRLMNDEQLASSPDTCPLDTIAYWKLDETEGSRFEDYLSSQEVLDPNDGLCTDKCPTPVTPEESFLNIAQGFNNSEIRVPSNVAFNWSAEDSFSIELWVNPDEEVEEGIRVFISRHTWGPAWWVGYDNVSGKTIFALRDSAGVHIEMWSVSALSTGYWHHIVAVHDATAGEVLLYIDGMLDKSEPFTFEGDWISTRHIGIGFHNDYSGVPIAHFVGRLDELAVYGKALSLAEIQYHFNQGAQGLDYCEPVNLAINIVGSGTADVFPAEPYKLGQEVSLTANPQPGFIFYEWSGDLTSFDNPTTLTMDGDKIVTAKFTPPEGHTLTLETRGEGSVIVTPEQAEYEHRVWVTLEAVPAPGWEFTGWSGGLTGSDNPAALWMVADLHVTATFEPIEYVLTVGTVGGGEVVVTPAQERYLLGTTVTLLAEPDPGWAFTGWSGDLAGSDNPATLTINGDKVVNASFVRFDPTDQTSKIYLPFNLR